VDEAPPVLWRPDPEAALGTAMAAFAERVGRPLSADGPDPHAALFASWEELRRWSITERGPFWRAVWEFAGVRGAPGAVDVLDPDAMPGARWFPEGRLSFAENLLAGARLSPDPVALVAVAEDGTRRELTWDELAAAAAAFRDFLAASGVVAGDRVAAWLPNVPEAVVGMLGASMLGAVWSSVSPDFGASGVLDRFGQIAPKVLLVCDGYRWKGRPVPVGDRVDAVLAELPSVERVVLVPYLDPESRRDDAVRWDEIQAAHGGAAPRCADLPFAHPLYVMYSSGTTGRPKCIVHGQGGTLLQHLKEHRLHGELRPGEPFFYYTTTGWMMWNWLVSGLASGARVVLYEGNPFHPGPDRLWRLAVEEGLVHFGISAKFVDACRKAEVRPPADLPIRTVYSTGSPLVPESFDWLAENVPGVQVASISGGTDLISCFALGNPVLPVYRGEIQCRGLGMAVEVWDPEGRPLVGEPGELVCTRPFPSMPVGFWNDPDGSRYHDAYFAHYPGVWRHGDWAELTRRGGLVLYGRSDATLNPGGVRIGTAEIYRQVEALPEVVESVAVGQDVGDGDQRVVLFVVLADDLELDDALRDHIRRRLREHASPRHVPDLILQVSDVPRTRSGKVSEIAVREAIHGRPVRNTEALANPEVLDEYRKLAAKNGSDSDGRM